jgi:hypothetical protein
LNKFDNSYKISLLQLSNNDIGKIKNKIEEGLDTARYGIIILSESFLKMISYNSELDRFIIKQNISGTKLILPVWHNVIPEIVKKYSPALTDWLSATTDNGIDDVAAMIVNAIGSSNVNETKADGANLRQSIEKLFLKQKYTLDLYRTWHSDMIRESRIVVSAWVRQFTEVNRMPSLSELRESGDKIEKHISRLLFYYEQWAIFSKQELIDKDLILKLLSSYLVWYHKIFIRPLVLSNNYDLELSSILKQVEQEVFSEQMYKFNDLKFC